MKKLSLNQKRVAADLLVNTAVAWFSIGVISQIVFELKNLPMGIISFIFSLLFSVFSVIIF